MNIIITDICNNKCPFCFANNSQNPSSFMTMDNLDIVINFLKKSKINIFKCLGGEPTLHPQFIEIAKYVRSQGLLFVLFTNGLVNEDVLEYLSSTKDNSLRIMYNASTTFDRVHNFLKTLKTHIELSITLYEPDFKYAHIFELIREYHLPPRMRIGIAHPIYGKHNSFIEPKFFKKFSQHYIDFITMARVLGISVTEDCGLVPCISESSLSFCDPVIDVGVDLNVWSCFPLRGYHNVSLEYFEDIKHINNYFIERLKEVNRKELFKECSSCLSKFKCSGGCLVHSLQAL